MSEEEGHLVDDSNNKIRGTRSHPNKPRNGKHGDDDAKNTIPVKRPDNLENRAKKLEAKNNLLSH